MEIQTIMSLLYPQLWVPAVWSDVYPLLLSGGCAPDKWHFSMEYPAACLVCGLLLGVQLHIVIQVVKALAALRRQSEGRNSLKPLVFPIMSLMLGVSFLCAGTLYCGSLLVNLSQFRLLWDQDQGLHQENICERLYSINFLSTERSTTILSVAVAIAMQILIYLADALLIYRCYMVFSNRPWVYWLAILPFLASIIVSIVAAVAREVLNFSSIWLSEATGVAPPPFATLPSLFVNIVVTASIATHIIHTRLRLKRIICCTGGSPAPDDITGSTALPKDTFSAATLLIEAALPSSIIGILVSLSSSFFPTFRFVAIISWAACTAMAPQLIMLRVLDRRDIVSTLRRHEEHITTIEFAARGELEPRGFAVSGGEAV